MNGPGRPSLGARQPSGGSPEIGTHLSTTTRARAQGLADRRGVVLGEIVRRALHDALSGPVRLVEGHDARGPGGPLAVVLPRNMYESLARYADMAHTSMSATAAHALERYLDACDRDDVLGLGDVSVLTELPDCITVIHTSSAPTEQDRDHENPHER